MRRLLLAILALAPLSCQTWDPYQLDVYGFAGGCYALRADQGALRADTSGVSWNEDRATPFRMRASRLGTYLLYDPEGGYVVGESGTLSRATALRSDVTEVDDDYISGAEWVLENCFSISDEQVEMICENRKLFKGWEWDYLQMTRVCKNIAQFTELKDNQELMYTDMHLIDSIERLELAYDDWKDGIWSQDPYIDMLIPTLTDPTMAPPGKHFMSVFVQYVPPKVRGKDWTDEDRDAFQQTVINQIDEYAPGFKDLVLHAEVRTPRELENEVGLTEGNIFQGELTMDQLLFNRPIPGYAQYRGPVRGLWMCGSSNHPGGGVMAAPGANAAREILMSMKKPNTVPEGWLDD